MPAAQITVICADIAGTDVSRRIYATDRKRHFERFNNRLRDFILDCEYVGQLPVIGIRPKMRILGYIDQLRCHAYGVTGFPDATFQHMIDIEFFRDFPDIRILALERE